MANTARFSFGKNWERYLATIDDGRIANAERSLVEMLGRDALAGKTFLDIGSGSGLFSLVAMRSGARRVHSFDYDQQSVGCGKALRRRFFEDDRRWMLEQGDVLDAEFMQRLGGFDVVYSWGVLHHTGAMWKALENACGAVNPGGFLFVGIYNDQGLASRLWRLVKRMYNTLPAPLKTPFALAVMAPRELRFAVCSLITLHPMRSVQGWLGRNRIRGMSWWTGVIDWVGGYPFEVARPEEVFDFCTRRGFELTKLRTAGGGLGNNEFVFRRRTRRVS